MLVREVPFDGHSLVLGAFHSHDLVFRLLFGGDDMG